jgi:Domain of unknown function DUF29
VADLYDRDFYRWTIEQATVLRNRRRELEALGVDWTNMAEELEALGRNDKRELRRRLTVLLMHLLKWQYQPLHQSPSWRLTIAEQRDAIDELLKESSSLKLLLDEILKNAYRSARRGSALETGLAENTFPLACPWTSDEVFQNSFLP